MIRTEDFLVAREPEGRTYTADEVAAIGSKAVCGYCDGHYPTHERKVTGPNSAGNYLHEQKDKDFPPSICRASGLFSWLAFQKAACS